MHVIFAASLRSGDGLRALRHRLVGVAKQAVPFVYSERITQSKNCLLGSFEAENPIFGDGAFFSGEQMGYAFTGVPLIDIGRSYDAEYLAGMISERGAKAFRATVGGTYTSVLLNDDAVVGFTDLCGRYPLFYAETKDGAFISNLPRLLGAVVGNGWSLKTRAAISLAVHSQIWGDETLFEGVKLLEPRSSISLSQGRARLEDIDFAAWETFGQVMGKGPRQYDSAAEALRGSFRAIKHLLGERPITLGLSGGKDSRIMAAYCVAGGLKDQTKFFTSGIEGSPEFEVAQSVASALGTATEIRASKTVGRAPAATMEAFRHNIGRYDAMLLPVAGMKGPHSNKPVVEITGFGGELYRRGISKQFVGSPITSVSDAASRWKAYHVKPDALGVIHDRHRNLDAVWMSNWVISNTRKGYPLQALPELFFSNYRVPLHQGLASVASAAKLLIDPLVHPELQRVHNSIGAFAGASEMTHASLLWHVDPALLKIRFLKDRWQNSLLPKFLAFEMATEPVADGLSDKSIRPIAWDFFVQNRPALEELTREAEETDLAEIVDFPAWRDWLKEGAIQSTMQINQAFTIAGLMTRATNRHVMPVDGRIG